MQSNDAVLREFILSLREIFDAACEESGYEPDSGAFFRFIKATIPFVPFPPMTDAVLQAHIDAALHSVH